MSRTTEVISGLVFMVLAIAVWMYAQTFPALRGGYPGPALFPQVISGFLGFTGLLLLVSAFRAQGGATHEADHQHVRLSGIARLLLGITLASLYPIAQEWLGFIPTVGLLSFGVAVMLRSPLLPAVLTSLGGTVLIYWIFTGLLGVPL